MKRSTSPLVWFSLTIAICSVAATQTLAPPLVEVPRKVISEELEHKIRDLVAQGNLPSLQAAVVADGRLVWSKAFGQDTSVTAVYMNGSVQKVFDATAMLQLHERGLVNIDNDVNTYLPFSVRHPHYPDIPITIRMLLGHRSGLDAFKDQFYWDTQGVFEQDPSARKPHLDSLTLEQFLIASIDSNGANYSADAWRFKPGTLYSYSVSAYSLVKYILERVTGESYAHYMTESILHPLSMMHSVFTSRDPSIAYARPFTRKDGRNLALPLWEGNISLMRSTAEDMTRFMLAHMNKGTADGARILTSESINLMHARYSHKKGIFNPSGGCPYPGYGLGIADYGDEWYGHGGSTVGFQTVWSFNTSNRSGYVIMTNVNGILHGRKNFDEVWGTVSAVEELLKAEVRPPRPLVYVMLVFCLLTAGAGSVLLFRRFRRRARAAGNTIVMRSVRQALFVMSSVIPVLGCSAIGYVVGSAIDDSARGGPSVDQVRNVSNLKIGQDVTMMTTAGDTVCGSFCGVYSRPAEEYARAFAPLAHSLNGGQFPPSLGETIKVVKKSEREGSVITGKFQGCDSTCIFVRIPGTMTDEPILIASILSIVDSARRAVWGDSIRIGAEHTQFPSKSVLAIARDTDTVRIPLREIAGVQTPGNYYAKYIGLAAGVLIDVPLVVLVSQWGSPGGMGGTR